MSMYIYVHTRTHTYSKTNTHEPQVWALDGKTQVQSEFFSHFIPASGYKKAAAVYIWVWKLWSAPLKNWCVPASEWEPSWWLSRRTLLLTNVWPPCCFYLSGSARLHVYVHLRICFWLRTARPLLRSLSGVHIQTCHDMH